jgi:hypothetical protein
VKGTHDDELMERLRVAREGAGESMAARNHARSEAEEHLQQGDQWLTARDYPKAIEECESGLSLDMQSDDIKDRISRSLTAAKEGLVAQEAARAEGTALVAQGQEHLAGFDHMGAIAAFEAAVALVTIMIMIMHVI